MASVLGSTAPGLLIAPPPLSDPNFDRTVVLMALHDEQGALGFVVNRLAPVRLGELLGYAGFSEEARRHQHPVYLGGPVQPSSGWVLRLGGGPAGDNELAIGDRVCVTSSMSALEELVRDLDGRAPDAPDPLRRMVLLGYSGWAPGQLDAELAAGAWVPVALDEEIVFDAELDKKWERAYARLGLSMVGSMMRGGGEA
jgi:putative transcriptional regulator